MSKSSREAPNATLYQLQQPEKLRNVLEQDKPDNWATAFIGLGAYSYFSGTYQLQKQQAAILKSKSMFGMRSRQAGIVGIAVAFVGMGFWRLVN
ncbi:hypothetical protein MMC08_006112 [Hypocenomyce scalaris]|nr:hypothetical protein [Hypocenomyce scalaris]